MTARFARFDAACDVNGAREKQKLLGQRGFACIGVGDDGKGAAPGRFLQDGHTFIVLTKKNLQVAQVYTEGDCNSLPRKSNDL